MVSLTTLSPLELALEIRPRARLDVRDVRAEVSAIHGDVLDRYARCLYTSPHTTAGYLPQSLAARLTGRGQGLGSYVELFRAVFPEGAGYQHDKLELREELDPAQRQVEPANADSHLAFMAAGLRTCVSNALDRSSRPCTSSTSTVCVTDAPRKRMTTLVGYDWETEVARTTLHVPVSAHPVDAINLKAPKLGLYAQIAEFIAAHNVTKGRVRIELAPSEQFASLTVNEHETLLMQHDPPRCCVTCCASRPKRPSTHGTIRALPGKAIEHQA